MAPTRGAGGYIHIYISVAILAQGHNISVQGCPSTFFGGSPLECFLFYLESDRFLCWHFGVLLFETVLKLQSWVASGGLADHVVREIANQAIVVGSVALHLWWT